MISIEGETERAYKMFKDLPLQSAAKVAIIIAHAALGVFGLGGLFC